MTERTTKKDNIEKPAPGRKVARRNCGDPWSKAQGMQSPLPGAYAIQSVRKPSSAPLRSD